MVTKDNITLTKDEAFSSDRRNLLIGSAAGLGALALTGNIPLAMAGNAHHHHTAKKDQALIKALHECVMSGEACIDHCLNLFKKGDVETVECMRSVIDTIAFCRAHAQLASSDSSHLNAMTELGIKMCESCEKECRKHEKKHAECKACADACAECVKACKAHLQA